MRFDVTSFPAPVWNGASAVPFSENSASHAALKWIAFASAIFVSGVGIPSGTMSLIRSFVFFATQSLITAAGLGRLREVELAELGEEVVGHALAEAVEELPALLREDRVGDGERVGGYLTVPLLPVVVLAHHRDRGDRLRKLPVVRGVPLGEVQRPAEFLRRRLPGPHAGHRERRRDRVRRREHVAALGREQAMKVEREVALPLREFRDAPPVAAGAGSGRSSADTTAGRQTRPARSASRGRRAMGSSGERAIGHPGWGPGSGIHRAGYPPLDAVSA